MFDYISNDYDKFIGKYITVIYNCDFTCKKIHCKLLRYCEKSPNEKLITLKAHDNTIYDMDCNKIICWTAEYEDMIDESHNTYNSNTNHIEEDTISENEDLLFKEAQDKDTIPLKASIPDIQLHDVGLLQINKNINSFSKNPLEEDTSLTSNENATCNDLQENNVIISEDKNKIDTSLESVSNDSILSEEHDIKETISFKTNPTSNQHATYNESEKNNIILAEYNDKNAYKKSILRSPITAFINCNFRGVYLTIYTSSTQSISGEVIFNYDYLIALKSDGKTYYINPEQITHFC